MIFTLLPTLLLLNPSKSKFYFYEAQRTAGRLLHHLRFHSVRQNTTMDFLVRHLDRVGSPGAEAKPNVSLPTQPVYVKKHLAEYDPSLSGNSSRPYALPFPSRIVAAIT